MSRCVAAAAAILTVILGAERASAQASAGLTYGRGAPRFAPSPASNIRGPGGYDPSRSYSRARAGGARGGYGPGARQYGYAVGAGAAGLALGAELAGGYGYGGGYYSAPYAEDYYAGPSYPAATPDVGYTAAYGAQSYAPDADYGGQSAPSYPDAAYSSGAYASQAYASESYSTQTYSAQFYPGQTYPVQTYTTGVSPCANSPCGGYYAPPAAAYPICAPPPPPPVYVYRSPCGC